MPREERIHLRSLEDRRGQRWGRSLASWIAIRSCMTASMFRRVRSRAVGGRVQGARRVEAFVHWSRRRRREGRRGRRRAAERETIGRRRCLCTTTAVVRRDKNGIGRLRGRARRRACSRFSPSTTLDVIERPPLGFGFYLFLFIVLILSVHYISPASPILSPVFPSYLSHSRSRLSTTPTFRYGSPAAAAPADAR